MLGGLAIDAKRRSQPGERASVIRRITPRKAWNEAIATQNSNNCITAGLCPFSFSGGAAGIQLLSEVFDRKPMR